MIQLITKFFGEMFLLGRLFFRLEAPLLVIMGLGVLLTILKALFCFTMSEINICNIVNTYIVYIINC